MPIMSIEPSFFACSATECVRLIPITVWAVCFLIALQKLPPIIPKPITAIFIYTPLKLDKYILAL